MQPHTAAKCLKLNEYCRLYGVGRTKAFEYLRDGRLERVSYGRSTCVTVRSADALMEALIAEAVRMGGR